MITLTVSSALHRCQTIVYVPNLITNLGCWSRLVGKLVGIEISGITLAVLFAEVMFDVESWLFADETCIVGPTMASRTGTGGNICVCSLQVPCTCCTASFRYTNFDTDRNDSYAMYRNEITANHTCADYSRCAYQY